MRMRAKPCVSTPTSVAIHSITAIPATKSVVSVTTRPAPSAKSRQVISHSLQICAHDYFASCQVEREICLTNNRQNKRPMENRLYTRDAI